MKILIARMNHETNTFSPVPTPLAAFGRNPTGATTRIARIAGCAPRWPRSSTRPNVAPTS